ncbi:hypothetical protein Goari_004559 [Gossypium aridum]|uniref:Uncharacterized protein n=1 Tax=Gossypium aridum TaxID=34290 RepID=A0A7J8Y3T7_GOSAI|nr:hypothetical protein [Gossypium aridum]
MVACSCCGRGSGGDYHFYTQGERPIHVPVGDEASYVGLPEVLEDIRLLLDNTWKLRSMLDAKVSLVVYTTVEMQESDWVLRQPKWRQQIPPPPRDLKELYKVDMQGKDNNNWTVWHGEYIDAWDRKIQFLLVCEPFFSADTLAADDYLALFRAIGKLYLLPPEEKSSQIQ